MNLFIETLADCLTWEWDRVLEASDGPKEARFMIQSLGPSNSFDLFQALESHRLSWLQRSRIECHFRVATGLWNEWRRTFSAKQLDEDMAFHGGLGSDGERGWIDQEDKLTWYRNRTRGNAVDGLVVVLLGLNHASDQGGLANFHRLDEQRIWQELEQSFVPWIERIDQRLGLSATTSEIERLDGLLHQLFETRPLQLERLASFLEAQITDAGQDLCSLSDLTNRVYAQLPFWDIPPFFSVPSGKKSAKLLKDAADFIAHKRFKSPAEQKKAWSKLEQAFEDEILDLPDTSSDAVYDSVQRYQETLRSFIFDNETAAKQRLMQTDLGPVLQVLKRRGTEPRPSAKNPRRLKGQSLESMLQAVWMTLLDLRKQSGGSLADHLEGIRIEVEAFKHDLQADDSAGIGSELLAQGMLTSCLGGLTEALDALDFRLPIDSDQAQLRPELWEKVVPIELQCDPATLKYGTSRARPHLQFKVFIETRDGEHDLKRPFQWALQPTQPERVRTECARTVLERWDEAADAERMLPAFQISSVVMTALYYAADEEEANRLVSQALTEMRVVNLLDGLSPSAVDPTLWRLTLDLSDAYRTWLRFAVEQGYYQAMATRFLPLMSWYEGLAERVLDPQVLGSQELLRRFYKAFLLVDDSMGPNDAYLRSAIVWGISPPVLELTHARLRFLCDGFPEAAAQLALGHDGKTAFEQLLKLAEIHRPLAGLVVDQQALLSAEIKSFGLLHHLGPERATEKSLAVQTLLREEEADDDEDVTDIIAATEERDVVVRVLEDYRQLYPFADDGMRILALHVDELGTILSGVDQFLRDYLKTTAKDWPAFHCEVMVYTTSSSPMAMESRLSAWRHHLAEAYRERGRPLVLSVGHRFAPTRARMVELVRKEARLYDIAFLFRFLEGELTGQTEPALPFEFDFNPTNISQFPICEYPRPIQHGDALRRQSLLSNRRLRIQTRHADLSARLQHPQNPQRDHLIFGQIDYEPWQPVVEALHAKAQWVACIDPFVDKRLLRTSEGLRAEQVPGQQPRKIVGFTSGLGDYGELNLSISTEQDTLLSLTQLVHGQLLHLLPFEDSQGLESMAAKVVDEAEEIIGLSSLRAVVGHGERVREVVGFAAIRRALATPSAAMSQLLPIDSLQHWFADSELTHRPDLLQLSLELREGDVPLLRATVIECKFAQHNPAHLTKASDQVQDGLAHLTQLFAPNRDDVLRVRFDRRYWWAQLQRAVTSRSVVNLPEQQWRKLDQALESLAEGYFEVAWQGAIFTFWTNEPGKEPVLTPIALPIGVVRPPLQVPDDFAVWHIALGYQGVVSLFDDAAPADQLSLGDNAIRVRSAQASAAKSQGASDASGAGEASNIVLFQGMAGGDAKAGGAGQGAGQGAGGGRGYGPSFVPRDLEMSLDQERKAAEVDQVGNGFSVHQVQPIDQLQSVDQPAGRDLSALEKVRESEPESVPETSPEIKQRPTPRIEAMVTPEPTVPARLLIGTRGNGEPVYWEYGHERLANRHLLVFGASGSGKTYGIQCLLSEMAAQGLHSLIVDYTDGFLPNQVEERFKAIAKPLNHYVATNQLPLNPFRRQQLIIDPDAPPFSENPYQVATRIGSIFTSVYETMGDQQFSTLIRVLEAGITTDKGFSLQKLIEQLEDDGNYGVSLASKLEPLIKARPFREGEESAWSDMLTSPEHWVHVLQLKGLGREIQKLVTEFALWDLYDHACNSGSKKHPIPVVLDEIQNLDHRSDSPIDKMLREGRKFGLSLLLATQTTSNFNQEQRDRLFQAGHKLFFKPADTEIERFATLLAQTTPDSKGDWAQRLSSLEKGKCWSLGPVVTSSGALQDKPLLVSVTALELRNFGAPR
ncbi:DUF87 domain-containing protein [Lamprobacter modestohalophilus]|uniref:ATP-binding protein n=1 Tax=Lamprobacter modestohalophilus TaxID=1064514 RepID=UPI002ADEB013|nr:DUF87 domain-containing protein [Lamprobacter modestohalophilus]MEA1052172.1 DUF87 domain-containing protein [Lamprobacter modestohalophilus]